MSMDDPRATQSGAAAQGLAHDAGAITAEASASHAGEAFSPLCALGSGGILPQDDGGMCVGKVTRPVVRVSGDTVVDPGLSDHLAVEVPVALECNGISYAVMLATPTDLQDFALGFALTEGIIRRPEDVYDTTIAAAPDGAGIVVRLDIASACEQQVRARKRALGGRTGCGLCGVEALPDAVRPVAAVSQAGAPIPVKALFQGMQSLRAAQVLFETTGATHAAGWIDRNGVVLCVREDVGRHNALDKLIGALWRQPGWQPGQGFVAVSSRASFEMVQKTAAAGIGALASVSAPTSLAVELAQRLNVGLAGFVRGDGCSLYAHAPRFAID